jgi:flagellar protein FlaJ
VVAPLVPASFAPLVLLGPLLLTVAAAGLLPVMLRERRRAQIDNHMHFYITRAGVLAKANLSAIEILRRQCDKTAYGALAEETERVVFLVTRWNMSISEACRTVSKRTPSRIFAEFLERLAYALDSGEELATFLDSEQSVVMEDFSTIYQGALYSLETLKEAHLSMAMSVVFLVVFGIVSPGLTGFRAEDFMGYALITLGMVDVIFLVMIISKAPSDPLWHPPTGTTPRERLLRKVLPLALAGGAGLAGLLLITNLVPLHVVLVAGMTPMVAVGLPVRWEEAQVRRRDENYPAFVRALGSATSAGGGVVRQVLRRLRHHNFGPLSKPLDRLYRRLHLRVDDAGAWRAFASESGSNLVAKFNAMFVEGTRAGGEPEAIGRMISNNYVRILNLRKHRRQTAQSFRSMLIGFMAGMAFTLQIGVGVLKVLVNLFNNANMGDGIAAGLITFGATGDVDFAVLALTVQVVLVLHALFGSMMAQAVEGGSFLSGYVDFVLMLWIAVLAGMVSDAMFGTFFSV